MRRGDGINSRLVLAHKAGSTGEKSQCKTFVRTASRRDKGLFWFLGKVVLVDIVYLIVGLGLIFLAAELFTNAIEWFGKHLKLSEGAVGSVFAAVGTALPETSVPLVAFIKGGNVNAEAGIGAIIGAPMMLSTLAMFVTGIAVLAFAAKGRRAATIQADYKVVGRDLRWFFLVYLMALGAAFVPYRPVKLAIAGVLLLCYAWYVHLALTCEDCEHPEGEMRPLHFRRRHATPGLGWVIVQLAAGLALIVFGARMFVDSVTSVSAAVGISTLVLSVIITPIATELPEKFNSITWMRHKKDTLALGNITGAMVFQSSVLPAIGIFCTGWGVRQLGHAGIGAIVVALLASSVIWGEMMLRKRLSPYSLLLGGAIYLLFPIYFFGIMHGKP
jgi:cation:H+ antiporter